MKIVIIGAGEVGVGIARQMISEAKDVVIIDRDPNMVKYASSNLDCLVLKGEGTSLDVLNEAGVASADIFIAATTSDEVNLIACFIVASEYNIPVKIARVRNSEYTASRAFNTKLAGVDYLVNTDQEAAMEISHTVQQGAGSSITVFENTDAQLRDWYVEEGSFFEGKSLQELRLAIKEDFVIAGAVRDGKLFIPQGGFVPQLGDLLYIAALKKTFSRIAKKAGYKTDRLKQVAIVGGNSVGAAVAEYLESKGRSVVLIDKDYETCKLLADRLPDVRVLNADISDAELFKEEDIGGMDVIVSATANEELNIISGVYAKTLGVKRAIAVVQKTSYLSIAAKVGIDSIISPKFSAINAILKFIRRGVQSVHSIFDGQAEAIQAHIPENSKLCNISLKELELPQDCLIVAVQRRMKTIIPDGTTVIKPGDDVIIFVGRQSIPELEELLA
jgi:trk system potassium uptake protein TrkA